MTFLRLDAFVGIIISPDYRGESDKTFLSIKFINSSYGKNTNWSTKLSYLLIEY